MGDYPRVLVISINCFSQKGSNGRTLANLFYGYDKSQVAQFYIHNERPDSPVCDNYFRVTDKEALTAFYKRSKVGQKIRPDSTASPMQANGQMKGVKRTPITCLAREAIWNLNLWKNKKFTSWIDEFDPQIVLFQAGDFSFLAKLAVSISSKRQIPLVVYNSEDYCFKTENYMKRGFLSDLFFPFFSRMLKNQYNRLLEQATHSIYICEELKNRYDKTYCRPSSVIYTPSFIKPKAPSEQQNQTLKLSYLGNLNVGRHKPLMEIGQAINQIDSTLCLEVFGKISDEQVSKDMLHAPGIQYKGFVSYHEVIQIMQDSDILVHAENFSEFYRKDLKYGFSTKIADSLASGTCFFVYAPKELALTKYLQGNNAACVVTEPEKMKDTLAQLIHSSEVRNTYIETALSIAEKNHNAKKNSTAFTNLLISLKVDK